jgi:hypothetical protein
MGRYTGPNQTRNLHHIDPVAGPEVHSGNRQFLGVLLFIAATI